MNKRMWTLALAAGLALPVLSQELVLGLTHAKTGRFAGVGVGTEIAVDIAVAEINAAGGVNGKKIRVEKFDTGSDAKTRKLRPKNLPKMPRPWPSLAPSPAKKPKWRLPLVSAWRLCKSPTPLRPLV